MIFRFATPYAALAMALGLAALIGHLIRSRRRRASHISISAPTSPRWAPSRWRSSPDVRCATRTTPRG